MANLTHNCEKCGKQMAIPERYLGRSLKCPQCGEGFRVDSAPPPAPTPPSPTPPAQVVSSPEPFGVAVPPPSVPQPSPPPEQFSAEASVRFSVKHVDILSAAKVSAALHGLLGLIVGVVVAFSVLAMPMPLRSRGLFALGKGTIAILALVAVPGTYLVMGLVTGALVAALYNVAVKLVGAVQVELE